MIHNLTKEDSQRRKKIKEQLMNIPEFVNILSKNKVEYSERLAQDNAVFQKKYGTNFKDLNEDFNKQYKSLENLAKEGSTKLNKATPNAEKDFTKKEKIYNEVEFKTILSQTKKQSEVAKLIYDKRLERNDSKLFTPKEDDHFEKLTQEIITQRLIQQYNSNIDLAETIPEIKKILKEAKTAFAENPAAFTQIENKYLSKQTLLQSTVAQRLYKHSEHREVIAEFFKYAGGAVAVLMLAKVMLPHAVFTEIRVLGLDLLRVFFAHTGIVAGSVGILSATGLGFFSRNRPAAVNVPINHLLKVFDKVMETCEKQKESWSSVNTHPSGKINELISRIKEGKSESVDALKKEFGMSDDDNNQLLIKQLTELSRALVSYNPAVTAEPAESAVTVRSYKS